jgi:hypothetical protein
MTLFYMSVLQAPEYAGGSRVSRAWVGARPWVESLIGWAKRAVSQSG